MATLDIFDLYQDMMSPIFEYDSHASADQMVKLIHQYTLVLEASLKETIQNRKNIVASATSVPSKHDHVPETFIGTNERKRKRIRENAS